MRSFLLSLCVALPLAGCGAGATPTNQGGGQGGYAGTSWRFVSIDGQAVASARAKLEFRKDELGANVGCNGMGGRWRIEGERLIAGPLVQTEMYCEGAVWQQERAVSALLSSAPEIAREGDRLTLGSSGHSAELERLEKSG